MSDVYIQTFQTLISQVRYARFPGVAFVDVLFAACLLSQAGCTNLVGILDGYLGRLDTVHFGFGSRIHSLG